MRVRKSMSFTARVARGTEFAEWTDIIENREMPILYKQLMPAASRINSERVTDCFLFVVVSRQTIIKFSLWSLCLCGEKYSDKNPYRVKFQATPLRGGN